MRIAISGGLLCSLVAGLLLLGPAGNTYFAAGSEPLPARVDLTPECQRLGMTPQEQGNRDVCSLFAVTAVADFENARSLPDLQPRLSEEFLIWAAKDASGKTREQAMFYEAVSGLNLLGICDRALMPYIKSDDAHRRPSPRAMADARTRAQRWRVGWIRRWNLREPVSDGQFFQLKRALVKGHPVACGLRWPNKLKGSSILSDIPPGGVFDGHSIAFVGYTDNAAAPGGGILRFRNSFGANWGEHGYGQMCYAYFRRYANDALWLEAGRPGSERPVERFEAESLPIAFRQNCDANPQGMNDFEGRLWSNGKQLFCMAKKGGGLGLIFHVRQAGRYRVRLLATAGPDYGKIKVALDGRAVNSVFDLYCGRISPSGSLELDQHDLTAGNHQVRCTVIGRNPASSNFYFGLDAIDLLAAK